MSALHADDSIHKNILRVQKSSDVFKKYEVTQVLVGSGSMGAVSTVKIKDHKVGGSAVKPKTRGLMGIIRKKFQKNTVTLEDRREEDHEFALKSIHLDRVSPLFLQELKNEIHILRSMDHPSIVKAHEVYLCSDQIYLVLELCAGGDLYTKSPYTEKQAARIMSQMCSALTYMHAHKIVHRDLKFENVMFSTKTSMDIKVIDFGLSKKFLGKTGVMTDRVGTMYVEYRPRDCSDCVFQISLLYYFLSFWFSYTMAPQVLQGVYSSQADLWAAGVIAYMLLSSSKPFYSKKRRKLIDLIMRGTVSFSNPIWETVSDSGKDFCKKLIVVDPKVRLNAAQAVQHDWIVNREQHLDELPDQRLLDAIDDGLVHYRQTSQLKKLALNVIAHRSTSSEILSLKRAFKKFDTENNGVLSFEEFKKALENLNYDEATMSEIFDSIDVNQNGYIMYTEWLAATIEAHGHIEEDRIAEAFDRLDSDDTGYISRANLKEVLGKDSSPEEIEEIIKAADLNKDGKISYQEFLQSFRAQTFKVLEHMDDSTVNDSENNLIGLDAKIPGGRFDSELDESLKRQLD